MSILDNFVTVNLVRHSNSANYESYDTAVYVCGTTGVTAGYYSKEGTGSDATGADRKHAKAAYVNGAYLDNYFKYFFDNGGHFLHVITDIANAAALEALPSNEIVLFTNKQVTYWPGVTGFTNLTGKYQKIFIVAATSTASATGTNALSGVVFKYVPAGSDPVIVNTAIAATAAYYTNVNFNRAESVKDYAFTVETVDSTNVITVDTDVKNCIDHNLNCDVVLAGKVRNVGGNDVTGEEGITNLFMRIVLQNEVANELMNALVSKIKYDNAGFAQVTGVISTVLERFITCGYISKDKVWTDNDLYLDEEKIIAKNMPLINGYIIHIAPISSLTSAEITAGVFPSISIYYGDFVGIRKINVNGEVF